MGELNALANAKGLSILSGGQHGVSYGGFVTGGGHSGMFLERNFPFQLDSWVWRLIFGVNACLGTHEHQLNSRSFLIKQY